MPEGSRRECRNGAGVSNGSSYGSARPCHCKGRCIDRSWAHRLVEGRADRRVDDNIRSAIGGIVDTTVGTVTTSWRIRL